MQISEEKMARVEQAVQTYSSMREQYEHTARQHNAVYALLSGNDIRQCGYHTCFGGLLWSGHFEGGRGNPDALLVQVQWYRAIGGKRNFKKKYSLFYEWLFNMSPYRDAFLTKNVSEVMKTGVIALDTEADVALMMGGAIASRNPYERFLDCKNLRNMVDHWTTMVEKGMNPNYAYALCVFMTQTAEGIGAYTSGYGHSPLNAGRYVSLNFINNVVMNKFPSYKSTLDICSSSQRFIGKSSQVEYFEDSAYFGKWIKDEINSVGSGGKKTNPFSVQLSKFISIDTLISHFSQYEKEIVRN